MKRQLVMTEDTFLKAQRAAARAALEVGQAALREQGVYVEPARLDLAAGRLERASDQVLRELLRDVRAELSRRAAAKAVA